ncbi:pilus assembly protein [Rhodobacter sphaeroides]|uniref:Flp family type IVb pilin n=1 Tax=Cereibacter sphaeroides TaxID=1063 RepID=UPI001327E5FA|nr:pilus assembly protein [Cereibacter sphaeroides]MWP37589.1 pilus assembly protein [Cereibacter sphaeroides]
MKLLNIFKTFRNDEDGAVTVDWVVLTAAIVGLGIAVVTTVSGGLRTAATTLTTDLAATMGDAATATDADTGTGTGDGDSGSGN